MNVYDLEDDLKIFTHETQNETATLISQSSGWTFKSVYGHLINIVQYNLSRDLHTSNVHLYR